MIGKPVHIGCGLHLQNELGCTGLTRMMAALARENAYLKGLEVFEALPAIGLRADTAITNAAISACNKGEAGHCVHRSSNGISSGQTAPACQLAQTGSSRHVRAPPCMLS